MPMLRLSDDVFLSQLNQELAEGRPAEEPDALINMRRAARRIRLIIEGLVRKMGIFAHVSLFGSFQSGFHNDGSDLDLSLNANLDRDKVSAFLQHLAMLLPDAGFDNITRVLQARIPLLKFTDKRRHVEIDLSVNNDLGVRNSKLLQAYGQYDSRVLELGREVKLWAKRRDLVGPSDGSLSSYAFVLLVIHFLLSIQPPVVPNLQQLGWTSCVVKDGSRGCEYWWETKFEDDVRSLHVSGNKMSLGELLIRFFLFFTEEFDWRAHAVCMRLAGPGVPIDKFSLFCSSSAEEWYIEDPFDLKHNLAGNSRAACRQRILHEMCSSLASIFETGTWQRAFPSRESESFLLTCRTGPVVEPEDLWLLFEECGIIKLYFPRQASAGHSKQFFIDFDCAASRRCALSKTETVVNDCLIQLQYTSLRYLNEKSSEIAFGIYDLSMRQAYWSRSCGFAALWWSPSVVTGAIMHRSHPEGADLLPMQSVLGSGGRSADLISENLQKSTDCNEAHLVVPERDAGISFLSEPVIEDPSVVCDSESNTIEIGLQPPVVQAMISALQNNSMHVKHATVVRLSCIKQGRNQMRSAAKVLMQHSDWTVRHAAVRALAQLAAKGSKDDIRATCACLLDTARGVRRMAVQALTHVADKDDKHAIGCIRICLKSEDPEARCSALKALAQISSKGVTRIVHEVCSLANDHADIVRRTAIFVLAELAEICDQTAVDTVCSCLGDADANVRRAALLVLPKVAQKGNTKAMLAIIKLLRHGALHVRQVAVKSLAHVVMKGDILAVRAMTGLFYSCSGKFQRITLDALKMVADKGDKCALGAVRECLKHHNANIRRVAVMAMLVLSEKGNARAIGSLCTSLRDPNCHVRHAAVMALEHLADIDDNRVIIAAKNHLERIRCVVKEASQVSELADWRTLVLVSARLHSADANTRSETVRALADIAEIGHESGGTGRRAQGLDDTAKFVRRMLDMRLSAIHSLAKFAEKGEAHAIAAVTSCLGDAQSCIRQAARKALDRASQMVDIESNAAVIYQ